MEEEKNLLKTIFNEFGDEGTEIFEVKDSYETMVRKARNQQLWLNLTISREFISFEIWDTEKKAKGQEGSHSCFKILFSLTNKKPYAYFRQDGYQLVEEGGLNVGSLLFVGIQSRFLELWQKK